jgi:hypothetical protein
VSTSEPTKHNICGMCGGLCGGVIFEARFEGKRQCQNPHVSMIPHTVLILDIFFPLLPPSKGAVMALSLNAIRELSICKLYSYLRSIIKRVKNTGYGKQAGSFVVSCQAAGQLCRWWNTKHASGSRYRIDTEEPVRLFELPARVLCDDPDQRRTLGSLVVLRGSPDGSPPCPSSSTCAKRYERTPCSLPSPSRCWRCP